MKNYRKIKHIGEIVLCSKFIDDYKCKSVYRFHTYSVMERYFNLYFKTESSFLIELLNSKNVDNKQIVMEMLDTLRQNER